MYKSGSGQKVNVSKFGIFFRKNTREDDRNKVKEILEIQRMMDQDCYLGMPMLFGKSKVMAL